MWDGLDNLIQKSLIEVYVGLFNVKQISEFVNVMSNLDKHTIVDEVFFE